MSNHRFDFRNRKVPRLSLSATSLFVLLLFPIGNAYGSIYSSPSSQPRVTVTSPPVFLQAGTAGSSTIYSNNTSAKVSVSGYGYNFYDFVDNNNSNVDSSANKGTHSNFTAQKYGPDSITDILTEQNTGTSSYTLMLYVNSNDSSKTVWTEIGTAPYLNAIDFATNYIHTASKNNEEGDFSFTDSGKSTETITSVTVQIYGMHSLANKQLEVFVWDGSSWTSLGSQTLPTSWNWVNYTATTVLNTWAKIDGAKIYFKSIDNGNTYYVDCARLKVDYNSPNYEADLEVQWTNVDYNQANEQLCIYGGVMGSESLRADVWTGSAWQNVIANLNSGWNNVTVSAYLTSSTFTIRFKDSIVNPDATQNNWTIDATLLHVWDYDYDYVLRVNNTVTDSWKIRLKAYSQSNIARLNNCTIYFHNATDGTSGQIYIVSGSYTQQTGPWYDLGSSKTVYIAMTTQAISTGTSLVHAYLEILIPNTTTYAQYVITYEIT